MFTESQLRVIGYCAEEVKRQGDTPNHVYYMLNAWNHMASDNLRIKLSLERIQYIGSLVEPVDNANGFRTIPIGVGNGYEWIEKANPETITRKLKMLLSAYYDGMLKPGDITSGLKGMEDWPTYNKYKMAETAEDVFYYEFEEIHPFKDGNGRTGKILYNYLSGTLDDPIWPPNFWGVSNP